VSDLSIFGSGYDEGPRYGEGHTRAEPTRAERRRAQQRRQRRGRGPLVPVLLVLLIIGLVGGILWGGKRMLSQFSGETPDFAGAGTGSVVIPVKDGDTAGDIALTLEKLGVVKSEKAFRDVAKSDGRSAGIQPGKYKLRKQMSAASALDLLLDPGSRVVTKFTLPEGLSVAEALKIISTKSGTPLATMQAAARNTAALGLPPYAKGHLEGVLWPATYVFDPGTPAPTMLKTIITTYREKVDDSGLSAQATRLGVTPYELLTVASLVEEEAITPDFGKVARVIYNRLNVDQRLQLDSTVNYALNRSRIRVSSADLEVDSPYNTYRNNGLPPTPISSPGLAALNAALHPTPGPWRYFVKANKNGLSYFTGDLEDFNAHKAAAQEAGIF
jgi:UPF0755 protein